MDDIIILRFFRFVKSKYTKTYKKYCGNCNWPCGTGTGLRPGEKLFEELLMAEEGMQETPNKLIHIGKPIEMDDVAFKKKLRQLDEAAYQETDRMRKLVAEVVPTYHPENGEHVKVKEA